MITLDVADYCSACMDFDPDVQRPQKAYGLSEEIVISDTVIRCSKLESENDLLKESCRVLCNRCFTLTRGVTCLFCGLDYPCPHMPGLEERVTMAHELRKGIEKNG